MKKLLITKTTSVEDIRQEIANLREQKGKETETLKLINESKDFGHDFVANLFFEEALTYQRLYMNDNSDKKALSDMEKTILKASFYVNKYKITKLNSRLF
jgi:beta-xylosidase